MGCFSSKPAVDPPPVATIARGVPSQPHSPPVVPPVTEIPPRPSSRQSTRSRRVSTQGGGEPQPGRRTPRDRAHSNPQRVPSMIDVELPPMPLPRTRAKPSAPPSSRGGSSSEHRQASAGECTLDRGYMDPLPLTDDDKSTQGHLPDDRPRVISPAGRSIRKCGMCSPSTSSMYFDLSRT